MFLAAKRTRHIQNDLCTQDLVAGGFAARNRGAIKNLVLCRTDKDKFHDICLHVVNILIGPGVLCRALTFKKGDGH